MMLTGLLYDELSFVTIKIVITFLNFVNIMLQQFEI